MTGETVEQFATRLRILAASCEFDDVKKEVKSAIIQNCLSKRLRRYALRESGITLDDLLAKARSLEASETQATGMEEKLPAHKQSPENINRVNDVRRKTPHPLSSNRQAPPQQSCRKCGKPWPHRNNPCPAKGQTCHKCGKPNHYAKVCRSSRNNKPQQKLHVRQVTENSTQEKSTQESEASSDSDDEYIFSTGKDESKIPTITVKINCADVPMIVDTGASTDIIDEKAFSQINQHLPVKLGHTTKRLFAYGSKTQLPTLGQFEGVIEFKGNRAKSKIHVLKGSNGSLLSYKTAQHLKVLNLNINHINHINKSVCPILEKLEKKYPKLFSGIGKLKEVEVNLHIDNAVKPVTQRARRIPFHIRKKVEKELSNLEQQDIIERAEGPTSWISPLVATPKKDGNIRICVDMRMANKAIKRERHPMPTMDDLTHILNGATVFSKLDLRSGYHQLVLSPECRHITTFATHDGLWRYKRLNFGTNSASEIFQKQIQSLLANTQGSLNISDDIIVFGKTQREHDTALEAVCQKLSEAGLTVHKQKCEFNKTSISFFGVVFSSQGIRPDQDKVEAIHRASQPTTVGDVRSFLGMATYCAKFIPRFSDVSEPLRELTKKDQPFLWTARHEKSFQKIKELLTSAQVMAYFDPDKETKLITDASPTGLSAILLQTTQQTEETRVVAYASRTLTSVESRYSQTEKEALAIVWAVEKLHIYLFGSRFKLVTDCKPLQLIFNNPKSKPPARIERWNLRLQAYDFEVLHMNGSRNPSDFLSRHPTKEEARNVLAEEYVQFLSFHAVPKAMTLDEIKEETARDITLQCVAYLTRDSNWNQIHRLPPEYKKADKTELHLFKRIKSELTVNDQATIVLKGSRIVLPEKLREKAVSIAHEGHQGLCRTKQLLREKVWFPGIDKHTERMINTCTACQANSQADKPEPLRMSQLPPTPWHTIHADFCGPFPSGAYLFVLIDAYSRYPEVDIVNSTSASSIIPKLNRVFATHGIPAVVCSDNGPPFTSHDIQEYMKENGIQHRRVTPLWPQANSEVERFMQPLTKAIRCANTEGKQWTKHLHRFLLNYRSTTHPSTGYSPAELLFNRKIQNKLPQVNIKTSEKDDHVRYNDKKAKEKMKKYADEKRKARPSQLKIGDTVLVRQVKQNKLSTYFDPIPFKIIRKKGSRVTAVRNGKYITRNVSYFKKVDSSLHQTTNDNEDDEDLETQPPIENPQHQDDEDLDTQTTTETPQHSHVTNPLPQVRRSTRNRNPPLRFGQYVATS
jgi:transposase InsO family protein